VIMLADTTGRRYRYFINGLESPRPEWKDLTAGQYALTVQTPRGCLWDTVIRIAPLPMVDVQITGDTVVVEGDSLQLIAAVHIVGEDTVDRYTWSPSAWMSCDTCARTLVGVTESGWVQLIVSTKRGCIGIDSLWVQLKTALRYFIPNAFSPNGDGWNDNWNLYLDAQNIEAVEIDIYTRWGERVVHKIVGVPRHSEINLWDGQIKGRAAPPGVYVGRIKLRERGGKEHLFVRSVTLLR